MQFEDTNDFLEEVVGSLDNRVDKLIHHQKECIILFSKMSSELAYDIKEISNIIRKFTTCLKNKKISNDERIEFLRRCFLEDL